MPADRTDPLNPIAVIGAGAAGLLAALFAARAGRRVVLIERTKRGGKKILISGGGRCNILPARVQPERFVSDSSRNSVRKILKGWSLPDQMRFFERELAMRLVLETETGKLFPETHRARHVRDRLLGRVYESGARVWCETRVTGVRPTSGSWVVEFEGRSPLNASAVILATGGLSVPSTGSDGLGLAIARSLGHEVHETYPALTPLVAEPPVHAHLAGISLPVTISAPGSRPRFATSGGFLFTHRGYSGPAVLNASHLAVRSMRSGGARQALVVRWTSRDRDAWDRALVAGKGRVNRLLGSELPSRLAEQLLAEATIPEDLPLAHLDRDARRQLALALSEYLLPWNSNEGFRKAEVTGGGVSLAEIDPVTMESRRWAGLFMCGEMLDAFGPIGGHNFLWAWVTGRAAGLGASARFG